MSAEHRNFGRLADQSTHLAFSKRSSWYSKLCTLPWSPTVRASECEKDPDPVPGAWIAVVRELAR